jgi:hypothetical protein
MTIATSNVAANQTFGAWLSITNKLAYVVSQNAVTVDSTAGGSLSTGNGYVNGHFGVNYLHVNTSIAGGNNSTAATLSIVSNTNFANTVYFSYAANALSTLGVSGTTTIANTLSVTGNVVFQSTANVANVLSVGANVTVNTTTIFAGNATANLVVSSTQASISNSTSNVTINPTSVIVGSSQLNTSAISVSGFVGNSTGVYSPGLVNATSYKVGTIGTSNGFIANTNYVSLGNSTVNTQLTPSSLVVNGSITAYTTLGITGAATLSNTIAVTGNATFSNTIAVTGNATFSNTIAVTGNATFSNTIAVTGNATFGNVTSNNLTVNVFTANTTNAIFSNVGFLNISNPSTNSIVNGSLAIIGNLYVQGITVQNQPAVASANLTPGLNEAYYLGNTTNWWLGSFIANSLSNTVTVTNYLTLSNVQYVSSNSYTFPNTLTSANVDTFSTSTYRSAEYLIQMTDPAATPPAYQSTKVSILHDGTNVYMTEYGTLFSNATYGYVGTINATIAAGTLGLAVTPAVGSNVVVRFTRTAVVV